LKLSQHKNHPEPTEIFRTYQNSGSLGPEQCLHLFSERLREYDANVTFAQSSAVQEALSRILDADPSSVDSPWIVADGFPSDWLPPAAAFLHEAEATTDDLNRCAGVITTCSAGIALTGTIVMQHGPGEGKRQTSLLPDRHLCVIPSSLVVETVPQAFKMLAAAANRPLTFISGPSATADIEMTRIRGVHGPRHLDVIMVGD